MDKMNNLNQKWFDEKLVWLLDKKENHELSCEILKQIGSENLLGDEYEILRDFYIDTLVENNHGSIDILLVNFRKNSAIAIKNTIYGHNTKDELSSYFHLEKMFPNLEVKYIYLYLKNTIMFNREDENRVSLVKEKYKQISWDDIVPILGNCKDNPKVEEMLSNLSYARNNPSLAYKRALKNYVLESLNKDEDKWIIKNSKIVSTTQENISISFSFRDDIATIWFQNLTYKIPFNMEESQLRKMLEAIVDRIMGELSE